jgi:hypothetical protein
MRILLDTDVLLDVALARQPHVNDSAAVMVWVETGGFAAVDWHSLTNCSYMLNGGRRFLEKLLKIVEVAPGGTAEAKRAITLPMADVEDAFQAASAIAWKADFIITRNLADYRRSPIPAMTPADFLKRLE